MKESNKDIAVSFLEMASSGEVDKAYSKFIGDNFKHHNAYYEGSADSLRNGMKENAIQNPNKVFWVMRNMIRREPFSMAGSIVIRRRSFELQMQLTPQK